MAAEFCWVGMCVCGKCCGVFAGQGGPGGVVRRGCVWSETDAVIPGGDNGSFAASRSLKPRCDGVVFIAAWLAHLWGRWHCPDRGQILLRIPILVTGRHCPTLEVAMETGGVGVTFGGGLVDHLSHPPSLAWGLPQHPSSAGRAAGGRAGDRAPLVSAWAECWQQLCAGAGMETCCHPGAAAGDADGCS